MFNLIHFCAHSDFLLPVMAKKIIYNFRLENSYICGIIECFQFYFHILTIRNLKDQPSKSIMGEILGSIYQV